MSLWSRITNVFGSDRVSRNIDEELRSHIDEAIEQGRDPAEARRAFGSSLQLREESRDLRLIPWLDSLRADAVFGWRQIAKRKVSSAAAILSLALAIGACTSAFRLVDALLLRPLPVAHADRLFDLNRHGIGSDGKPDSYDVWAHPAFDRMRAAVRDQAELIAVSLAERLDLNYSPSPEIEKAYVQYVSGWMFDSFGLRPSLGRLLNANDDITKGAHPVAVLSYDYWTRRFGQDPVAVGRTFRMDERIYEIVGVGPENFTGTETGIVTGIFVPTMMNRAATAPDATWHRTLAIVKPGVAIEPLRQKLSATSRAFEEERLKGIPGITRESIDRFLDQKLMLDPAAAGASGLQHDYRSALLSLGVLVALVLLIACANVANLMTAQASARGREMALRVSIGAGRARLIQLVLVESAWLAFLAAAVGALFAWWSAPLVVGMIDPVDNQIRLILPADWRVLGFGVGLTLAVTFLFGLLPALRASSVKPASALRGGDFQGSSPHSRRRLMNGLIAVQVAFCFMVLFVAGLFAASFNRLAHSPMGFSAERVLALDATATPPQSAVYWEQVADRLRAIPGIENVALARWALLNGYSTNQFISINGAPPTDVLTYFLNVSPGWLDAMKIPLLDGRDFLPGDTDPGTALVNESFVKIYFPGQNPIGRTFERAHRHGPYRIVGVVRDAPYRKLREAALPVAYVPFQAADTDSTPVRWTWATFIVRTSGANPMAMAAVLRGEVSKARGEFRVSDLRSQTDLVRAQTVRERLLALLAMFFASVALVLAGIGLYGVLDYSVLQRRREIGIRLAIGAQAGDIARRVTREVFAMVLAGGLAGVGLGLGTVRYIESLLYQVRATELNLLALPILAVIGMAMLAALPPVLRAVRIDPVSMLRAD
jgi:putative ABC transport system permease protein